MKRVIVILLIVLPVVAQALEREKLNSMLAAAAGAQSNAYLEARQAILDLGSDVLSALAQAAVDPALTWQQRLVARISYERIVRGADIEKLRRYDWRRHPQYKEDWERHILGSAYRLGIVVVPTCKEYGLWYYYLELRWKTTGELAIEPWDKRINESWTGWCVGALIEEPECTYLLKVLRDVLEADATLTDRFHGVRAFRSLLELKDADAVPVLVERYDVYFKQVVNVPEAFPGRHAQLYAGMFGSILSFADSRHAEMLEKFIAERPALAPLKEQVAEIRKRPAPPPRVEPPFRLGQERVKP